jgi:hypothetical protein
LSRWSSGSCVLHFLSMYSTIVWSCIEFQPLVFKLCSGLRKCKRPLTAFIHNIDTFWSSIKKYHKITKSIRKWNLAYANKENNKTHYGIRESKSSVHPDCIFKNILNSTDWCPCALNVTGQIWEMILHKFWIRWENHETVTLIWLPMSLRFFECLPVWLVIEYITTWRHFTYFFLWVEWSFLLLWKSLPKFYKHVFCWFFVKKDELAWKILFNYSLLLLHILLLVLLLLFLLLF